MPHAPLVVASSPVLRPDWETLARLASIRSKPLNLDTCLTPSYIRRFCGTTDKPKPAWFWDPSQETVTMILMPKSTNWSCRFWGPNRKTVNLGFEAQQKNSHSSSPYIQCRPHTASPDLLIIRSLSIWHVLDHPWSSAPGLILMPKSSSLRAMSHLLPTHHETSKHDSPHEQR
jgi:hypothetical protein